MTNLILCPPLEWCPQCRAYHANGTTTHIAVKEPQSYTECIEQLLAEREADDNASRSKATCTTRSTAPSAKLDTPISGPKGVVRPDDDSGDVPIPGIRK